MRLDDNNPKTLTIIRVANRKAQLIRWLNRDSPIDVCMECYYDYGFTDDVAHPSYPEGYYICFFCGCTLALEDNSEFVSN